MNIAIVAMSRKITGTWLGREGECRDYKLVKKYDGIRIHVHRWLDTGDVEISLIDGNAIKGTYQEFAKVNIGSIHGDEIKIMKVIDYMIERCNELIKEVSANV